jgi:hypothetical protein
MDLSQTKIMCSNCEVFATEQLTLECVKSTVVIKDGWHSIRDDAITVTHGDEKCSASTIIVSATDFCGSHANETISVKIDDEAPPTVGCTLLAQKMSVVDATETQLYRDYKLRVTASDGCGTSFLNVTVKAFINEMVGFDGYLGR